MVDFSRFDATVAVLDFSAGEFKCSTCVPAEGLSAATPRLVCIFVCARVCACETQYFSGQVEPIVSAAHAEFSLVVVTNRQTKA